MFLTHEKHLVEITEDIVKYGGEWKAWKCVVENPKIKSLLWIDF